MDSFPHKTAHIEEIIHTFWEDALENRMNPGGEEKVWDSPLMGIAAGDDPLFSKLKKMIGPFFWTPLEAYTQAFPTVKVKAANLRVIVYILPQTDVTREDQRAEDTLPSRRWAASRFYGEQFNRALRKHLAQRLCTAGYPAVAPELLPDFAYRKSKKFGIASNWSERHAAFIAGLGTFGLSDGLITRRGKAVRFGSVVAEIPLPITPRPYGDNHHAWCLWYARHTCGACVRRCPIDAISTESGHDKEACFRYIRQTTAPYVHEHFDLGDTPCGLCQVGIPCEYQVPPALL
ncbi:MAG: 4Fe-4S ferredoxin [Desulfuromonadaceae bacterium]